MKKFQLKNYADLFGKGISITKVTDSTVRKEIILLSISLSKPAKDIDEEIQSVQNRLMEGHEEQVREWSDLTEKINNCTDEKERKKLEEKRKACTEAERINKEFNDAVNSIMNEDAPDVPIRKVELSTIIDALDQAGILSNQANIEGLMQEFKEIIKD